MEQLGQVQKLHVRIQVTRQIVRTENWVQCSTTKMYLTFFLCSIRCDFLDVALLNDPSQSALPVGDFFLPIISGGNGFPRQLLLLPLNRMLAPPQLLQHLCNTAFPLGELSQRKSRQLFVQVTIIYHGLLISKLGKMTSANLGTIRN